MTAIDPVCGMTVDPATALQRRAAGGGVAYFCSASCAAVFDADPGDLPRLSVRAGETASQLRLRDADQASPQAPEAAVGRLLSGDEV